MRTKIALSLLFLANLLNAAEDIRGFWKTVNEDGVAQCIIAVYSYEGLCYGRIIATFNDEGKIDDSIYHPVKRAPGLAGEPFYSGLDIIWYLQDVGSKFKGKILDPEHGDVYKSELWVEGDSLIVRGKLFVFGRSQRWFAVTKEDIPKDFKLPDTKTFVPSIPET